MKYYMGDVYRRGPSLRKLLLELKEAILDFVLNVAWQFFLSAHQLWLHTVVT